MRGWGKREIPEKTHRPVASSGTIPTCENPGVTQPRIEPTYRTSSNPYSWLTCMFAYLTRPQARRAGAPAYTFPPHMQSARQAARNWLNKVRALPHAISRPLAFSYCDIGSRRDKEADVKLRRDERMCIDDVVVLRMRSLVGGHDYSA
ncbi:hypothetical protein PR048_028009 [Dryococelus australis]|uniref:Uncharacterized protein n=1 Tax=Dryococelus australis TaxID=614101 RepID=A0ABQ9GI14_9NEOP|nr:hypothetical protein PR048_028009 [Dryococelus australis]